jgi:hypothetical protein
LSEERSRHFCAIYSMVFPEYTAFVFNSDGYRFIKKMFVPFKCFLFSNGEGMDQIREDMLNICSQFCEEGDALLLQCLKTLRESMQSWNCTCGKDLHFLFNMKTIEDRYAKQKVRLQAIAAAESPSENDESEEETETQTRRRQPPPVKRPRLEALLSAPSSAPTESTDDTDETSDETNETSDNDESPCDISPEEEDFEDNEHLNE